LVRRLTRLVSAAGLGAVIATAVAGFSFGASAAGGVTRVYTNDNTAGVNTVAGFQHNADGSLTALPGSPFAAGGAGTGTIVGSQGSLQATGDGRFILAADAGSNQISVLRIAPDGSLAPVDGSPFSSQGIEPISIAVNGDLVYVANEGNGVSGSNYSGFRLTPLGRLIPIPGSTVALPATANPGDILFNSTSDNLVGVEVGTNDPSTFRIDSFLVGANGRL